MIIKKYLANTVEEALTLVKQELGPSHVVLTTRQVENKGILGFFASTKVEVTAAVEEADLKAHTSEKIGKKGKAKVAAKSKSSNQLSENLKELKEMLNEQAMEEKTVREAPVMAPTTTQATYGDPRFAKRASTARVLSKCRQPTARK